MKTITLLTCLELDDFIIDDELLVHELESRGYKVKLKAWEDFEDEGEDLFIIRTTWNYTDHLHRFLGTLENIQDRLLNPIETVRWNSNKKYLKELESHGVKTMPLEIINSKSELEAKLNLLGGDDFIVKPLVSAGAKGLVRFNRENLPEIFEEMILQKFYPEILKGEISLFYFNHQFSYAIKKTPKKGEIRVQEEFGGLITCYDPSESEFEIATSAIKHIPGDWLYARVDIVPGVGLIELECVEPSLYLSSFKQSSKLFSDALEQKSLL